MFYYFSQCGFLVTRSFGRRLHFFKIFFLVSGGSAGDTLLVLNVSNSLCGFLMFLYFVTRSFGLRLHFDFFLNFLSSVSRFGRRHTFGFILLVTRSYGRRLLFLFFNFLVARSFGRRLHFEFKYLCVRRFGQRHNLFSRRWTYIWFNLIARLTWFSFLFCKVL